jgi:hypothetical protein
MRAVVMLIAVLVTGIANADPQPWMKKANPNELVLVIFGPNGECPASRESLHEAAKGVLTRSRIKAIEETPPAEKAESTFPWLVVGIGCQDGLYEVGVDFIVQDATGFRHRAGLFGYGSHGTHGNSGPHLVNSVRNDVEAAITDYLKANFDL